MTEEQIRWLKDNIELDLRMEVDQTYDRPNPQIRKYNKIIILKIAGEVIQEIILK